MKTMILCLLLSSVSAFACPGARIMLNDDTTLTGTGMESKGSGNYDLSAIIKNHWIGNSVEVTDSHNKSTHSVVVLGGSQDSGGIISVSYLVKDLKSGSEEVYLLKSNYLGDGVRARGLEQPDSQLKSDDKFKVLKSAGC